MRIKGYVVHLISSFILVLILRSIGEGAAKDSFTYVALDNISVTGNYQGVALGDAGETAYIYLSRRDRQGQILRWNGKAAELIRTETGHGQSGAEAGAAWADFDGDGDQDLYVSRYNQPNLLFRNDDKGKFPEVAAAKKLADAGAGQGVSWVDYDGDGDLDLYVVNYGMPNQLYRNDNEATRFAQVSVGIEQGGLGLSAAWADYDRDGDQDMYLVNFGQANQLFDNEGGNFSDVAQARGAADKGQGVSASWVDYDGDGDWDLSIAQMGQPNKLLRYHPDKQQFGKDVARSMGLAGRGQSQMLSWGDYDRDGDLDVYVVNGGDESPDLSRLYRNDGKRFTNTTTQIGLTAGKGGGAKRSKGAIWWDMDTDGDLDLFVVNNGQENSVYRNEGIGEGMRGVVVNLQGERPDMNMFGMGGVVRLWSGGKHQLRQMGATGEALSQGSQRPFFGVGKGGIDSIKVVWPDGNAQTLKQPRADAIIRVKKGKPQLAFRQSRVELGSVVTGRRREELVPVTNKGDADLIIHSIAIDPTEYANILMAAPHQRGLPITIRPGMVDTLKIGFVPNEIREYQAQIIVDTNAGEEIIRLRGAGVGDSQLENEPPGKSITIEKHLTETNIVLRNNGPGVVEIEKISIRRKAYSEGLHPYLHADHSKKLPVQVKPGNKIDLTVSVRGKRNARYHGWLIVDYNAGSQLVIEVSAHEGRFGKQNQMNGVTELGGSNFRISAILPYGAGVGTVLGAFFAKNGNTKVEDNQDRYERSLIPNEAIGYLRSARNGENKRSSGLMLSAVTGGYLIIWALKNYWGTDNKSLGISLDKPDIAWGFDRDLGNIRIFFNW